MSHSDSYLSQLRTSDDILSSEPLWNHKLSAIFLEHSYLIFQPAGFLRERIALCAQWVGSLGPRSIQGRVGVLWGACDHAHIVTCTLVGAGETGWSLGGGLIGKRQKELIGKSPALPKPISMPLSQCWNSVSLMLLQMGSSLKPDNRLLKWSSCRVKSYHHNSWV